jgi:hypothetical protein
MKLIDTFVNGWSKTVNEADNNGLKAMLDKKHFQKFDNWFNRAKKLVRWSSRRWGPNKVVGHIKDPHLKARYNEVYQDVNITKLQANFANGWYQLAGMVFALATKVRAERNEVDAEALRILHKCGIRLKRWAVMRWGESVANNLFMLGMEAKGKVQYDKV